MNQAEPYKMKKLLQEAETLFANDRYEELLTVLDRAIVIDSEVTHV